MAYRGSSRRRTMIKHMCGLVRGMLFVAAVAGLTMTKPPAAHGASDKVTICYIPPGNPANAHTIRVGAAAVPAHLAHGDSIGECGAGPGPG